MASDQPKRALPLIDRDGQLALKAKQARGAHLRSTATLRCGWLLRVPDLGSCQGHDQL